MITSKANLAALNVEVDTRFTEVFEGTAAFADRIATTVRSSSAVNLYAFVMQAFRMREWKNSRQAQAMQKHSYSLPNIPFEATLECRREDVLDDALGLFYAAAIPGFAEAVRKHPDDLLISNVFSANPTCFDGKAFWASDHPTYHGSGTYDNDVTCDASSIEALGEGLGAIRADMMTVSGESGILLRCDPRVIIAPPEQEVRLRKAIESTVIPSDGNGAMVDNPIKGMFSEIIIIPELSALSSTVIYMADLSRPIKPFIWQVRADPVLRSFDNGQDEAAFNRNVFTWGIDGADGGPYRVNAGVSLPFLCDRITLTDLPT